MISTLLVGDFLLVNKFCYGYSNDSFRIGTVNLLSFLYNLLPFLHIDKRLLVFGVPKRGDVVVFHNKKDKNQNYIKRIIGLPGDQIELKDGVVYVNDKPVELKEDGEYTIIENDNCIIYKKYIEKLPNGYEHVIIKLQPFGEGRLDNVGPFMVPDNHYFMLGDNRDNSQDSRVMEKVGFIHLNQIMGRAELLFFSSSCKWYEVFKWPFSIRFERIFSLIH
jgi:signal peptidase I